VFTLRSLLLLYVVCVRIVVDVLGESVVLLHLMGESDPFLVRQDNQLLIPGLLVAHLSGKLLGLSYLQDFF